MLSTKIGIVVSITSADSRVASEGRLKKRIAATLANQTLQNRKHLPTRRYVQCLYTANSAQRLRVCNPERVRTHTRVTGSEKPCQAEALGRFPAPSQRRLP